MPELTVELYGHHIGVIQGDSYRTFDITFEPSAITHFGASSRIMSLAVPLDLKLNRTTAKRRRNFFAGLLPEGRQLTSMARNAQLSELDVLGLLARYGRDVAGAIQIWDLHDPGEPRTPKIEPVSDAVVSGMLNDLTGQPLGNARTSGKTSLPGVQAKIVLAQTDTGWARVHDGYPSTHILKPVANEFPTMIFDEEYGSRFVRALGLANFATQLTQFGGTHALVIERYDRDTTSPGGRIHQEDLAQALGVPTIEKYQKYGAVTLERVSRLLAETDEPSPNVTLAKMLTLSVALGNLDMHAKNISLLHAESGTITIAPMYDVVPQTQYDTDGEFAFTVNGVLEHRALTRNDLMEEITQWGLPRSRTIIDETLETVRSLVAAETPHPSAEPTLQAEILRFTNNLLNGHAVGDAGSRG